MSVGLAISTVVGANILMAVSGPDLTRFARTGLEGVKSVSGLAAGYPLIMLASGIPALAFAETDIMKIMVILGVALPALFILVFSTWTTNTVNLYSAVLTLAASFRRFSDKQLALAAGALGTLGAVLGIMDVFLPFVLILGIATTPIAGVYIADFFLLSGSAYRLEDLSTRPPVGYSALPRMDSRNRDGRCRQPGPADADDGPCSRRHDHGLRAPRGAVAMGPEEKALTGEPFPAESALP